jgi:hypothetical protein
MRNLLLFLMMLPLVTRSQGDTTKPGEFAQLDAELRKQYPKYDTLGMYILHAPGDKLPAVVRLDSIIVIRIAYTYTVQDGRIYPKWDPNPMKMYFPDGKIFDRKRWHQLSDTR